MKLSREERRNCIGIAMSGGGLQGIAHIGAIKALYELGIHPQFVSGTSSGAAMAAITAMGFTAEEMTQIAKKHWKTLAEIDNGLIFKSLAQFILNKNIQRDGIKSGELIADVIREVMYMKNIHSFQDMPINLSICTVDTLTTDECIFTTYEEGLKNDHIHYLTDVPPEIAVRASMSFPAIYTTCTYKNYNFIDGGSKDNLHVYSINGTRESMKMADYAVEIKNENTALFDINNVDETIQEGYEAIMREKDRILEIFG